MGNRVQRQRRRRKSGLQLAKRRRVKIHYENIGALGYKGDCGQTTPTGSTGQMEAKMDVKKITQEAIETNPEIKLVLEIAARARETEARTPAMELTPSTDVVALPNQRQCSF